uniref:Uncharacterized protein n=1 Tax=Onchocerca volvulus TaxID=6282 RepID=A0A8R1Y1N4_ONCVO
MRLDVSSPDTGLPGSTRSLCQFKVQPDDHGLEIFIFSSLFMQLMRTGKATTPHFLSFYSTFRFFSSDDTVGPMINQGTSSEEEKWNQQFHLLLLLHTM